MKTYSVDIEVDHDFFLSITDQRYIAPAWFAIRDKASTESYNDKDLVILTLQNE